MWKVRFETKKVESQVEAMIAKKLLTAEDQAIIAAWIRQVSAHGPLSIRGDKKWSDHALRDKWAGYRSSAFSYRGRIIYKISDDVIEIFISRITDIHDYS